MRLKMKQLPTIKRKQRKQSREKERCSDWDRLIRCQRGNKERMHAMNLSS